SNPSRAPPSAVIRKAVGEVPTAGALTERTSTVDVPTPGTFMVTLAQCATAAFSCEWSAPTRAGVPSASRYWSTYGPSWPPENDRLTPASEPGALSEFAYLTNAAHFGSLDEIVGALPESDCAGSMS